MAGMRLHDQDGGLGYFAPHPGGLGVALRVSEFGLFEQPIDSAGSTGLKVLSRDPFNFGIVRHAARSPLRPGLRNARPVVNASTRMTITVMVVSQSMALKTVADVSHSQWPAPVLGTHLWYC